jgi:hypothetical protein
MSDRAEISPIFSLFSDFLRGNAVTLTVTPDHERFCRSRSFGASDGPLPPSGTSKRAGSGNLGSGDKWVFCLNAA